MTKRNYRLHNGKKGAALAVRVTPRATRNQIAEILHDGTIRIRLEAAPGAELNSVLKEYLSQVLAVPATSIDIVAGETGRDKLISVINLDSDTAHQRILENLS